MQEKLNQNNKIKIKSLSVPTVKNEQWKGIFGSYPHAFQSRMTETIERMRSNGGGAILLNLPTGLGKTRALISHAILKRESVIIIYPNNTLLNDQARQIRADVKASNSPHEIIEISAYSLREYMQETETRDFARKGRALYGLLSQGIGSFAFPKIILMNPDYLTLILHGKPAMSQMDISQILQHYSVICFDEMHTYDVKQLCSIIHAARLLQERAPIVCIFSSATVGDKIKKMIITFPDYEEEDLERQVNIDENWKTGDLRPVLAPLTLLVERVDDWQGGKWVLKDENLKSIRGMAENGGCVIIFDSIPETMSVYSALSETEGLDKVGLVIGAVETSDRKSEMIKNTVVGNNAIRVGIDFSRENAKRNAVVYARTSFDAVQGLGRMGRGETYETTAFLLAPKNTEDFLNNKILYPPEGISRKEFSELIPYAFFEREKFSFSNYIEKYAHIEAIHAQEAVGIEACKLMTELFRKDADLALKEYKEFKRKNKYKELLDDLTTFRSGEPFQIAVIDEFFRQKGLFEFYTADVFRTFKFGAIYPISWDEYQKELNRKGKSSKDRIEKFKFHLEERYDAGDIVGICRIKKWNAESRKVYFCNPIRIPNPTLSKNQLLYSNGWELVKNTGIPNYVFSVYDKVCEKMREQKHTFIIFSRTEITNLPHLFKTYPIDDYADLAIAFGHNAFLIDSIINTPSCYVA